MYIKTTNNIKVSVFPDYLEEYSKPDENTYVWSYTVQLENYGVQKVQLINRYWQITDGRGNVQEVRGEGVVGEQPFLKPGEAFQYTSGVPLNTSSGIMQGAYEMECEDGQKITVEIPAFSLDSKIEKKLLN